MARTFLALLATAIGFALPLSSHAVIPPLSQPAWAELTPEQKQTLAPLAGEWDRLEAWRRKKWVGIAQRYSTLKPEEQARVQRRMKDWVSLRPEERTAVREKYKRLQNAPPEQKEAVKQKWQEYKELPDEEKDRLQRQAAAAKLPPKPVTSLPAAAAPAPQSAAESPAPAPSQQ